MCEHGRTNEMRLGGRVWGIDACIAPLVKALNQGGMATMASCCGHGKMDGVISLQDGRELVIMSTKDRERHFEQFPHTIHGEIREKGQDDE